MIHGEPKFHSLVKLFEIQVLLLNVCILITDTSETNISLHIYQRFLTNRKANLL